MKQEEKYLQDLELLKKLEPIMEKLGVEEDGYKRDGCAEIIDKKSGKLIYYGTPNSLQKTYRLDTLLSVLPDWWSPYCYEYHGYPEWATEEMIKEYQMPDWEDNSEESWARQRNSLIQRVQDLTGRINSRGQEALKACGELIILLDSEGIELKGENDGN